MVGTSISHYKILEKIGEGGMDTVYRATDTKLNRDVALKILPEQFASDSQRMGRFQREAEVLASLDHPNIGQIYGIEEAGATKALVLQLIEGPTLAEKIAQGAKMGVVCKRIAVTEQTYYRWRKEYGGLRLDKSRNQRPFATEK